MREPRNFFPQVTTDKAQIHQVSTSQMHYTLCSAQCSRLDISAAVTRNCRAVLLGVLTLLIQRLPHNILANVIFLGEIEQLADPAGPLGTKTTGHSCVSQPRNVFLTFGNVSLNTSVTALLSTRFSSKTVSLKYIRIQGNTR